MAVLDHCFLVHAVAGDGAERMLTRVGVRIAPSYGVIASVGGGEQDVRISLHYNDGVALESSVLSERGGFMLVSLPHSERWPRAWLGLSDERVERPTRVIVVYSPDGMRLETVELPNRWEQPLPEESEQFGAVVFAPDEQLMMVVPPEGDWAPGLEAIYSLFNMTGEHYWEGGFGEDFVEKGVREL